MKKTILFISLFFMTIFVQAQSGVFLWECIGYEYSVHYQEDEFADLPVAETWFGNVPILLAMLNDFGRIDTVSTDPLVTTFAWSPFSYDGVTGCQIGDFLDQLTGWANFQPSTDFFLYYVDIEFSHGWQLEHDEFPFYYIILQETNADETGPSGDCDLRSFEIIHVPPVNVVNIAQSGELPALLEGCDECLPQIEELAGQISELWSDFPESLRSLPATILKRHYVRHY